jgi:AraC-like DNA-binding protein
VRESFIRTGPPPPQPTVPHPERHPFCEFTIGLEGRTTEYIAREKLTGRAGAVMLLGPGIPHTAELLEYPIWSVTVYFLPILLFDMGPQGDGVRVLSRFTAEQPIKGRMIRPPSALWRRIKRGMLKMLAEFRRAGFGSELRLRSLLTEMLVELMRWEETEGKQVIPHVEPTNWDRIQRALRYMQDHHTDSVYMEEVARAAGVSTGWLKSLFRKALGMSCMQYLKAYRISLAAAMLSESRYSVTEAAFAVGFETLSHFNASFRDIMGMSPTEYVTSLGIRQTKAD